MLASAEKAPTSRLRVLIVTSFAFGRCPVAHGVPAARMTHFDVMVLAIILGHIGHSDTKVFKNS